MRRLIWGLLATLGLVLTACGDDGGSDAGPGTAAAVPDVVDTALAASSRTTADDVAPTSSAALTVLVTNADGVDSPALDAAVSVLLGRADLEVVVMAPDADSHGTVGERDAPPVGTKSATMTGYPALAVAGSMTEVVVSALAPEQARPDLVVIGLAGGPEDAPGTASTAAAEAANAAGVPALLVAVDGPEPDHAAAGLMLASVLDYQLDLLLDRPRTHVLRVPWCTAGLVDGPVVAAPSPAPSAAADCTSHETSPFDDETAARAAGFATLSPR